MAVVIESSAITNPAATGSTIVINKPSGTVDGDLLVIAIAMVDPTSNSVTTLSGWTAISNNASSTTAVTRLATFRKIASSEPSSWTWTISGTINAGVALRISGFDTSTPVDANQVGTSSGTSLTFAESIIPLTANDLLLYFVLASRLATSITSTSAYAIATSNPTWTQLFDSNYINEVEFSLAYATRPQTTATGNATASVGPSSAPDAVSHMIAIKRSVLFTTSVTDTEAAADAITASRMRVVTPIDTETVSDTTTTTTTKQRNWNNQSKNTSSWNNQIKH